MCILKYNNKKKMINNKRKPVTSSNIDDTSKNNKKLKTSNSKSKSKSKNSSKSLKAKNFDYQKDILDKCGDLNKTIFIWVDGSSIDNPGPGGCAICMELPPSILNNSENYLKLEKILTIPNFGSFSSYKGIIGNPDNQKKQDEKEDKEEKKDNNLKTKQNKFSIIARYEDYKFMGENFPSGKAELCAVELALDSIIKIEKLFPLDDDYEICILSDSTYAIGMFDKGHNANTNFDEVERILEKIRIRNMTMSNQIRFEKVYAHSTYSMELNKRVDLLARKASGEKSSKKFIL